MPFLTWIQLIAFCITIPAVKNLTDQNDQLPVDEGKASYYASHFHGQKTASGELYDTYDYTAAHRSLPFGTYLNVVNERNNYNIIVKVNDRGPFVRNRIIDLSEAAARRIGGYKRGVVPVKLTVVDLIRPSAKLDSIYNAFPIVDCLGTPAVTSGIALSLWSTHDLVHAIYIAGDLYLKENKNPVFIANRDSGSGKEYFVLVGNIPDRKSALEIKSNYEHQGFMRVEFFQP